MAGKATFPCTDCGADLEFKPGTDALVCPYCGAANKIETPARPQEDGAPPQQSNPAAELDYHTYLQQAASASENMVERVCVDCDMCGAEITLDENQTSGECPFCGSNIVAEAKTVKGIKPETLLPFKVTKNEAVTNYKTWLKKLWFAPNKLKQYASMGQIMGIYCPYWTYDSNTTSRYRGERGEYYYETETYEEEDAEGNKVTKTREVRKTRWYPASGTVHNTFDDVMVVASSSLPEGITNALEPWDLENLTGYNESYLSGFRVENYTVELEEGFDKAKDKMEPEIRSTIRHNIGGDEQRISSVDTQYSNVTFKHLLLPLWISAYRYNKKTYRFLINGRTGEVQGERPWSVIKIVLTVLGTIGLIGGIVALINYLM